MLSASNPVNNASCIPRLSELRESPDGVELLNSEGRISFVGGQGMQLLPVDDMSDLVGRIWLDFWPARDRPAIQKRFERALAGEMQTFRTVRATINDDIKQWEVTMSPVPNASGYITSVLAISRELG
ncbi:PAS domain-containing protein [Yoonia sediminilitoris]|uniref:PAS domain-containing protein n=1 Tax=Yoonia sediminilitoris TaxID=1286148 RepID=A0A2T6KQ11_9RHOB|nr:PAS domain-containing protein [Yoonia sediminilitoris]RCW98808.1 PAS domain-containing protein [Yoonia sediminilitoris]